LFFVVFDLVLQLSCDSCLPCCVNISLASLPLLGTDSTPPLFVYNNILQIHLTLTLISFMLLHYCNSFTRAYTPVNAIFQQWIWVNWLLRDFLKPVFAILVRYILWHVSVLLSVTRVLPN